MGLDYQLTQTDIRPFVILHLEHKIGATTSTTLSILLLAFYCIVEIKLRHCMLVDLVIFGST